MTTPNAPSGNLMSRRRIVASLASFGGTQGTIAVCSFVRLPFLIHALGESGFGLNVVISGLIPVLLTPPVGLRLSARTIVSEAMGSATSGAEASRMASVRRLALRVAVIQAAVTIPLAFLLPLHTWLGGGTSVGPHELGLSFAVTAALCAICARGGADVGALEAHGRVVVVNVLIAVQTAVGVVVILVASRFTSSFLFYATLNTLTSTAHYYVAPLIYRSPGRRSARRERDEALDQAVRRSSFLGATQSAAPLATRALDPFVIGPIQGANALAVYGLAQRLSMVTTFVPQAVVPLFAAHTARRRGAGSPETLRRITVACLLVGGLAAASGGVLVVVGPRLASFLTRHEFTLSRGVLLAFLLSGVAQSALIVVSAAASSPTGLMVGLRLDSAFSAANIALSVILCFHLGIAGPVYASAVCNGAEWLVWLGVLHRRPRLLTDVHAPVALLDWAEPVYEPDL